MLNSIKNKRKTSAAPAKMATPPNRGTGLECNLREAGESTKPNQRATRRILGVLTAVTPRAIRNTLINIAILYKPLSPIGSNFHPTTVGLVTGDFALMLSRPARGASLVQLSKLSTIGLHFAVVPQSFVDLNKLLQGPQTISFGAQISFQHVGTFNVRKCLLNLSLSLR